MHGSDSFSKLSWILQENINDKSRCDKSDIKLISHLKYVPELILKPDIS